MNYGQSQNETEKIKNIYISPQAPKWLRICYRTRVTDHFKNRTGQIWIEESRQNRELSPGP